MAYQLLVNRKAEKDIEETIDWYEAQSIGLGIEFLLEFISITPTIAKQPSFFTLKNPPYRRALMKKFPYAIWFAINDNKNEVIVLAVWNVKRDPEKLKQRLK